MAERLSTGMRNWILGGGSYREALDDCVMKIYSGTAPSSADSAVTGTLLVTITKSSGTVSTTERSTPDRWAVTIPGTHATGTYILTVTVDSTAYTCTYDAATEPEGHAANTNIAQGLARKVRESCNQVFAIADADTVLYIQGRVSGLTVTVADGGGTVTITGLSNIAAGARSDALYFGLPASGSMSKATADTWSGLVAATGVAGYFRIVRPDDDGTLSTTARRLQGNCSTSGAELNMSSTSLTVSTTHTVDAYTITQPAEE